MLASREAAKSPRLRAGKGRGHASFVRCAPSPALPRKREREQTESAACVSLCRVATQPGTFSQLRHCRFSLAAKFSSRRNAEEPEGADGLPGASICRGSGL